MKNIFKKISVGALILLFMAVTFGTPLAQGFSFPEKYDLVAILVEQGMYADTQDYSGLVGTVQSRFLNRVPTTLKARVDTYATDVQKTLPGTRVVIIQVDRFEKPENVRSVLQRLYFDGDPEEPNRTAFLKGIVVVGEVPLPVVKKSDNRFISLFPYTDLENSAYIFNQKTGDFELNSQVTDPRVEVWHGVIRPPVTTQTPDGRQLLAAYFDKNHLYHSGDPSFANFNRRLFFQDFFHEQKSIDESAYKSYLAFLDHQDDVIYNRYTKTLFKELSAQVKGDIDATNAAAASARDDLAAAGVSFDSDVPKPEGAVPPGTPDSVDPDSIPDIQTLLGKMSDSLMKHYDEVFSKYPNLVNDFVRYTGRYLTPKGDDYKYEADSSVSLIATKDLYVMAYLRAVNDMVEKEVDARVNRIQKNVPIESVKLKVTQLSTRDGRQVVPTAVPELTTTNSSGAEAMNDIIKACVGTIKTAKAQAGLMIPQPMCPAPIAGLVTAAATGQAALNVAMRATGLGHLDLFDMMIELLKQPLIIAGFKGPDSQDVNAADKAFTVNYINFSPQVKINDLAYFPSQWPDYPMNDSAYGRDDNDAQVTLPAHMNGVQLDKLTSAEQCSLYLGSFGEGQLSKAVEANRAYDLNTAKSYDEDVGFVGLTDAEKEKNLQAGQKENIVQCDGRLNNGRCEAYEHFGGCFYDGSDLYASPNDETKFRACYPDHATDPVFDPAGTKRLNETPYTGFDSYYACLNFRPEETLYKERINIDQIFEKLDNTKLRRQIRGADTNNDNTVSQRELAIKAVKDSISEGLEVVNPDPGPDEQVLVDSSSGRNFTLTLGDILRGAGWTPQNDPTGKGWKMVLADLLLKKPDSFDLPLTNSNVSQVHITLDRKDVKEGGISSVRTHKEPTNSTLNAQARSLTSADLPVDQPRYITFQNQGQQLEKIIYPDTFGAKNFEEYVNSLKAAEAILNAQPKPDGFFGPVCDNCLTSLLIPTAEDSVSSAAGTTVNHANQFKVADAIDWKGMDVDSKHVYLAETFSDSSHSAFIDEPAHSYEIAYFNGEGDTQGYDMAFNRELNKAPVVAPDENLTPYYDDPNNPFDDPPPSDYEDGYLLFTWSPPPISPWWDRVVEWKNSLSEKTNFSISFGGEKDKKDAEIAAQNESDLKKSRDQSLQEIAQPALVDEIETSRITKITAEADSTTAVIGKKVVFTVTARDKNNAPVTDEFSKITVASDKDVRILNADDDPTTTGIQISVTDGKAQVAFVAPDSATQLSFTASVVGHDDVVVRAPFNIVKDAQLTLQAQSTAVVADGRALIPLSVTATNSNGVVLTDVNGTVRIGVSDDSLGVAQKEVALRNGRGQFVLKGGQKKGQITLYSTLSNLNPGSLTITLLPGPAVKLALIKDAENLIANPDQFLNLHAQIFDQFNNLIDTNTGTPINFSLDASSQELAQLSAQSVRTQNGDASVRLLPKGKSGAVKITAQAQGLRSIDLTVDVVKKFGTGSLSRIVPDSLVAALLGIPAGNVESQNAFGTSLLFGGKTQAVTTLTTSPKQYGKIFEVNDRGGLQYDDTRVGVSFVPENHLSFLLRDTRYGIDLAKVSVVTKKDGRFEVTNETDPEKLKDGIYMRQVATDAGYAVDLTRGALRVVKDDEERINVQTNGYVKIFDQDFTVRPKLNTPYLTLEVRDGSKVVAEVTIIQRFNQDVRLFNSDGDISNDAAGVYVHQYALPGNFFFEPSFTGNTSSSNLGLVLHDRSEEKQGAGNPGFAYNSFEDSLENMGVGFTRDNKFALLFAAGNTFGESNREYMSDAAIVLGDPTVKLGDSPRDGENFSNDIGSLLFAGPDTVKGVLPFDVNSDGLEDILIVQSDNKIRYLQNKGGVNDFEDRGAIVEVKNGIQDYSKTDINNDGQMDLIIAGKEGCKVDETCVDIYTNNHGTFTRTNISFDQKDSLTTLKAADMNGDHRPELVMVDTSGDVSLLYQTDNGFRSNKQVIGNVGLKTDSAKNLSSAVLIRYAGMPELDPQDPDYQQKYAEKGQYYQPISLTLPDTEAAARSQELARQSAQNNQGADVQFDPSTALHQVQQSFMYLDAPDSALRFSTKYAEDLNGGVLRNGDRVRYTIKLINIGNSAVSRVSLSDVIAGQLTLDRDSIKCGDCVRDEMQLLDLKEDPSRPILMTNITVPANGQRTITYEATFSQASASAEKVTLDIRSNFADSDDRLQAQFNANPLPDISINKDGNTSGQLQYLISTTINPDRTVNYVDAKSTPNQRENPLASSMAGTILNGASAESFAGTQEIPDTVQQQLSGFQTNDADGDGLQDSIDKVNGQLSKVGDLAQAALNKLTCDAGCIALPVNSALFAPGFFSVLGVPTTFDGGTPAFAWGIPSLIPVWPPSSPYVGTPSGPVPALAAGGRFYIAPTLTGGIGFGLCLGPYGTPKNCYAFGINPFDLLPGNICDKINGGIQKGLDKAAAVVDDAVEGATAALRATSPSGRGGTGLLNYSFGNYEPPLPGNKNARIPGFPKILTDWWAAQLEEIIDKATDLPDLYVIYPKLDSVLGSVVPTEQFERTGDPLTNVLSYINSIPLINIQTDEVTFKVPIITEKEIAKLKADALQWVEDEKLELDRWKQQLKCFIPDRDVNNPDPNQNPEFLNLELCKFVDLNMTQLINTVTENVQRLDEWKLFPKKVMQWRTVKSYYVQQVVNYLDTVIEFLGGWLQRNTAIVKQWRKTIREMKDIIEHYKILVQIMIEANASCDKCKTERYGLDELVLKLFAAIPRPPVIPLPKLPDIVVDVSKIQAGVTMQWPDVHFQPEPFIFPKLPRIHLGLNLTIPLFKLQAPAIPLIPEPPTLPNLPALPELKLGSLPDLPPAPKLPPLPHTLTATIDILRQLLRIYCIIKLGLTPTDELMLKTRIEQITARGLTPILPIDKLLAFPGPSFSVTYVDQIIVTAFLNLNVDVSFIQKAVEEFANKANGFTNDFVKSINKYTENLSKSIEQYTSPQINVNINKDGSTDANINGRKINLEDDFVDALKSILGTDVNSVADASGKLSSIFDSLDVDTQEYSQQLAQIPSRYVLTVDPITQKAAQEEVSQAREKGLQNLIAQTQNSPVDTAETLPLLNDLIAYREALDGYNNGGAAPESLGDLIAQNDALLPDSPTKKYLASTTTPRGSDEPQKVASMVAEDDSRLLAQVPNMPDGQAAGNGGPNGTGSIDNVGIFYNDSHGDGRRLVNYTLEASEENYLADIDADNDGDKEKVFSYGQNVYIKENHRVAHQELRQVFRREDIEFTTVSELLRGVSAPRDLQIVTETAHSSTLQFTVPEIQQKNIVGFNVVTHNSINAFDQDPTRTAGYTAHFVVKDKPIAAATQTAKTEPVATLALTDGLVKVNGAVAEQGKKLLMGDSIATLNNAAARIDFSDGTRIQLDENTSFTIPDAGSFVFDKGDATMTIPENSQFFAPGTTLSVAQGTLNVVMPGGSNVELIKGADFDIPLLEKASTVLTLVTGEAHVDGSLREYIDTGDSFHLEPGDKLHAMGETRVLWNVGSEKEVELTMKDYLRSVPDSTSDGVDVKILDGKAEVIKTKQKGVAHVESGAALLIAEKITPDTGAVEVRSYIGAVDDNSFSDADARRTVLRTGQSLSVFELDSLEDVSMQLPLEQGLYVARVQPILQSGEAGVTSGSVLLAPQSCGDRSAPYANAGSTEMTVSVGKELTIDASRSFDADGSIVAYHLDMDTSKDSNNDGVKDNDPDRTNTSAKTDFMVGPFTEVGDVTMKVSVYDEAHNEGTQNIIIHVVKSKIVLDPTPLKQGIITGHVEPREANVPVSIDLLRANGGGGWKLLTTPSANENEQYLTDENGVFTITDVSHDSGMILVNDEEKGIAHINKKTGRITVLDDRYELRVLPADSSQAPVRMAVYLKGEPNTARPYSYSYIVPDVNTDVTVDKNSVAYSLKGANGFSGVHIKPLSNKLTFEPAKAGEIQNPGGVTAFAGINKEVANFSVNGDIFFKDPTLALTVKPVDNPRDSNEPVVFNLSYRNEVVAEILFAVNLTGALDAQAEVVKVPQRAVRARATHLKEQPFVDVPKTDPLNETLKKLFDRGIVAGYQNTANPGSAEYRPEQNIARAEFTQITLKMLCIAPRAEAKRFPTPFYDVPDTSLWFYPVLKEGNIRGFIKGYLGESRRDSKTGQVLTPFRPANSITRGEATTVVLAALDEEGIIDLNKADMRPRMGDQWYDPYIRVAQDLTPYLVNPLDAQTRPFLLTQDEAARATELITRRDFALMAERVLLMRDCGNPDKDSDGMNDVWETQHQTFNADDDIDRDTCTNQKEFEMGTDPRNPDTDGGGTPDCTEIARGTDPVGNPVDDKRRNEGVFIVDQGCGNVCPCRTRLQDAADIDAGDIIFAAISGPHGIPIYAKSNEEKYPQK